MKIKRNIGREFIGILLVMGLTQSVMAEVQGEAFQGTNAAATNFFLGKTGIGTNDPAKQLHVVGDSRLDGSLTVDGAFQVPKQGDVSMGIYTNGVSDQGVVSSNLALRGVWISYDGANQGIYVASNGNVGVGTSSPDAALQVNGSVTVTSNLVVQGVIQGTATNAAALQGHGAADFYPANNPSNWISHASSDGKTYGSKNGTWSEMTATGGGNFTNPSPVDLVISNANLLVGPTAGSPNSANVLVLSATSAPSNSPEGVVQLWAETVQAQASGGSITTQGSYRIHKFTTNGTFVVSGDSLTCRLLLIGGGGSGGGSGAGGGGGAGGFIDTTGVVVTSGTYTVTVGNAQSTASTAGNPSRFLTFTAFGGGGGGNGGAVGKPGASGGGAGGYDGATKAGGACTNGQGYVGGTNRDGSSLGSGGGGGAGEMGQTYWGADPVQGGAGGDGRSSDILVSQTNYYAGGGGGGVAALKGGGGMGGAGGGGKGSGVAGVYGGDGTNGFGGGGGGQCASDSGKHGKGGSGIVIIRYLVSDLAERQELRVRDSSGNVTTLSPHNTSLIPTNITARQEFPMTYYSKNDKLGLEMNVDLLSFIRDYEKMSGKQYIYVRQLNGRDKSVVTNSDVLVKPTKE